MNDGRGGERTVPVASRAVVLGGLVLLLIGCGSMTGGGSNVGAATPGATRGVPGVSSLPEASGSAAPSSSPSGGGSVSTYRGDAARTGAMPGPAPSGTPGVVWTFKAGAPIGSSAAVMDGIVYLLGNDGVVHALTLDNGVERWQAKLGADASASPLVAGELLIVGDSTGIVHALVLADGSSRWALATDGPISGAAAADGHIAIVATKGGSAYAIDISTGTIRWRTAVGGPVGSSVAIADGTVYLGAGPNLTALALGDGKILWKQAVSKVGRVGTPTVAGGMVYAATGLDGSDRTVYGVVALDGATGAQRWRFVSPTQAVIYTPAVVAGRAYIVGEDRRVTALDAKTGASIWTAPTEQVDEAVPAVVEGLVFVAGNGGALNALDASTGAIRWTVPYRGVPYGPIVVGGYVVVGTDIGTLYAIGSAK